VSLGRLPRDVGDGGSILPEQGMEAHHRVDEVEGNADQSADARRRLRGELHSAHAINHRAVDLALGGSHLVALPVAVSHCELRKSEGRGRGEKEPGVELRRP
jgi:hypothetical protein